MTQWSIWGGFMKKTRGQKSRATVPLNKAVVKEIIRGGQTEDNFVSVDFC